MEILGRFRTKWLMELHQTLVPHPNHRKKARSSTRLGDEWVRAKGLQRTHQCPCHEHPPYFLRNDASYWWKHTMKWGYGVLPRPRVVRNPQSRWFSWTLSVITSKKIQMAAVLWGPECGCVGTCMGDYGKKLKKFWTMISQPRKKVSSSNSQVW